MYFLINVTLPSCTMNKERLKYISNSVVRRFTGNGLNHIRFGTYLDEITDHVVCYLFDTDHHDLTYILVCMKEVDLFMIIHQTISIGSALRWPGTIRVTRHIIS